MVAPLISAHEGVGLTFVELRLVARARRRPV